MSFGLLTKEMARIIRPLVRSKVVYDLGAGDLSLSRRLSKLGAARVVAVDKEPWLVHGPGIEVLGGYFDQLPIPDGGFDVAFTSWPVNNPTPGLVDWLKAARTVIYLGTNLGGEACGFRALFEHLSGRELLAHVPHPKNTLVAVGRALTEPRDRTPEEEAAFSGGIRWYNEVYPGRSVQVACSDTICRE